MGTTEIVVDAVILSLIVGFLLCFAVFVLPAWQQIDALKLRNTARGLQKVRDDMDYLAYRAEMLNAVHKGTPYIDRTPAVSSDPIADAIVHILDDNERWSRKAPELKAVES